MEDNSKEVVVNDRRHGHLPADVQTIPDDSATPMQMLATAIQKGMPIETLDKLMDLQERWDKAQAKKAFDAAMAAARTEFPEVKKSKEVKYEVKDKKPGDKDVSYFHETLEGVTKALDPILGKHGLSYDWNIQQETFDSGSMFISVTCTLTHSAGHSKAVTMKAPPDDSGKKNRIQQIASTITYMQRYTLKSVCGIAAGDDDDARSGGGGTDNAEYDTEIWLNKIDAAFDSKNREAVEKVRNELQAENANGKVPKWAHDMMNAHFASKIKEAKRNSETKENEAQTDDQ